MKKSILFLLFILILMGCTNNTKNMRSEDIVKRLNSEYSLKNGEVFLCETEKKIFILDEKNQTYIFYDYSKTATKTKYVKVGEKNTLYVRTNQGFKGESGMKLQKLENDRYRVVLFAEHDEGVIENRILEVGGRQVKEKFIRVCKEAVQEIKDELSYCRKNFNVTKIDVESSF